MNSAARHECIAIPEGATVMRSSPYGIVGLIVAVLVIILLLRLLGIV